MILYRLQGDRTAYDHKGGPSIDLWYPTKLSARKAAQSLEPWLDGPTIKPVILPRTAARMAEMLNHFGGSI